MNAPILLTDKVRCPICEGIGNIMDVVCLVCDGTGRVTRGREAQIRAYHWIAGRPPRQEERK